MSSISDNESNEAFRRIGKVEDFRQFPAAIQVDNDRFFIVHFNVRAKDEAPEYKLVCHLPSCWRYRSSNGRRVNLPASLLVLRCINGASTNVPGEQLECQPLAIQDGHFVILASS